MATTHKVEIAFATDPDAVTPTWTDVTAYVWAAGGGQIVINRGRADQLSTITPSQLSLTLDNRDGRFTAGYTSGAYYPNVVLGKRIRVSTNAGGGFVERFDGYVNVWPVQWAPSGRYAEAQITAVDRLARLGRQLTVDNLISTYYLAGTDPTDYWMFADPADTTIPYNRTGTTRLGVGDFPGGGANPVTYGDAIGPPHDGLTAMTIKTQTLRARGGATTYTFSETQGVTMCGFMRVAGFVLGGSSFALFDIFDNLSLSEMAIMISGSTVVDGFVVPPGGGSVDAFGTTNVMDGGLHFIGMVCQPLGVGLGGTISIYVDGVLDGTAAVPTGTLAAGISAPVFMVAEDFGGAGTYTCAHFAVFPAALTAQNMADFSAAGLTAFSGETSLARATRIAGLANVTPVVTGTAGTTSMAPLVDVNAVDYLSLLQAVADTEQGLLFTQTSGEVRLRPRTDLWNQATKWTLTTGQYGGDLTFLLDDFGVVNDVVADRPDGNAIHQTNSASVTANGTYSQSKTLQTTSDNEVLDYANWTLATSVPAVRCSQVTVDLLAQPSLVASWLTMELGDVIACTGLPPTSAPATSVTMQIQGWTETIALDSYRAQMNTTPYLTTGFFTFNHATLGKFNTGGILAY